MSIKFSQNVENETINWSCHMVHYRTTLSISLSIQYAYLQSQWIL